MSIPPSLDTNPIMAQASQTALGPASTGCTGMKPNTQSAIHTTLPFHAPDKAGKLQAINDS